MVIIKHGQKWAWAESNAVELALKVISPTKQYTVFPRLTSDCICTMNLFRALENTDNNVPI